MSGIWPQCLHGSETCVVPKSVLKRLRTQAGRVASIAKQGVSPWLACSVGSPQLVDPEFCLLVQRLRLFRLMWRDFPDARPRMQKGLCARLRGVFLSFFQGSSARSNELCRGWWPLMTTADISTL